MSSAEHGRATARTEAPERLPDSPAPAVAAPNGHRLGLDTNGVLALQRGAGNAAVSSLLGGGATTAGATLQRTPAAPVAADLHIAAGLASTVRGAASGEVNGLAPVPLSASARGADAHGPAAGPRVPESAGKSDELESWKAAIEGSTAAIAGPRVDAVTGSPDALADRARTTEDERKAQQPDFAGEARALMPPAPRPPQPAEQLDTSKADYALARVDQAGQVKLSDQVFPPMVPMPAGLAPPRPPQPLAPDTVPDAVTSAGPGGQVKPDPNAHAAADRLSAVGPVQAGKGPADGAILSDPGVASLDPLPPAQADLIGDAAARVVTQAPVYAQQIVDGAAGTVAPGNAVASLTAIAKDYLTPEQAGLTTELEGVAAAAGLSAEQLKLKVAAKQAEAVKAHEEAGRQLEAKAAQATQAVAQRGQEELQQISGASLAVKEEVAKKEEAAKGASDPSVINARRDGYLEKINASVATGSARLRAAKERRIADLQRVGSEQKMLYAHEARTEAARAAEGAGGDATQGKIAARPLLDWGAKQALEVDGHVARLTRLLNEEIERHEARIKNEADDARELIRDWAAEKQGRQRGWWERLMDMVHDYMNQAVATNQAWERRRNAETRDKIASDLTMLTTLRDNMRKGNRELVLGEMTRMSAEQRAVFSAFLGSGGKDAIGAVAAGLAGRIIARRIPELGEELEKAAIDKLDWEQLNAIGAAQTPGFDARQQAREVGAAIRRIGTNEDRLFKALTGRTKLQLAAMRKAYAAVYDGDDMDADIDSDVSGSEQDRADALRTGDPVKGAVATLRDAMDGAGTDEDAIYQTLRGKTPAERDAIIAEYEKTYHVSLKKDLKSEMKSHELGQAYALLDGDTAKADAEALKDAMDGAGTSESGIDAVYARVRDEVEADAVAKGMKTAEVEAEIKRRNNEIRKVYGDGDNDALIEDFHSELSGGELKYALAEQEYDQTAMDAATLQKEHEGMWASDTKITDTLRNQYMRAEREILRDRAVDFQAKSAKLTPSQRREAWKKEVEAGKALAIKRSTRYMADLRKSYNQDAVVLGPNPLKERDAFTALIDDEVSGYDQDEARERVESGGHLSDAKELYYSIYGVGTKEARIRETTKGKSKAEIKQIEDEYRRITGNELADDLEGDLSGRDEADQLAILQTGDATPEEKAALLAKRTHWEVGDGTGVVGELDVVLGEEERILLATNQEAQAAYGKYAALRDKLGEDHPDTIAARDRLERWLGYGDQDIELHRESMDRITDIITTVGAVAVGAAVTIISGGTFGPAVAAYFGCSVATASALAGAVAATAASMISKRALKGGAYGGEDFAIDFAQGTAEAMIAAATVGGGAAALKALRGTPVIGIIARAAEAGVLKKLAYKGAEVSLDGLISGLPSGMMGAILDENTWKAANPFAVILQAGGQGAEAAIKMGAITSTAHGAFGAIKPPKASGGGGGGGRRPTPSDGVPVAIHDEPSTHPHTSDGVPHEIDDGPSTHPHSDPDAPVITEHDVPPSGPHEAVGPEYGPEHERVDLEPEGDSDGVPDHIDDNRSADTTIPHESERTNKVERPADPATPEPIIDEPGGGHIAPSDGVPQVPGSEDTHPVRDTEPQERPGRTPDADAPEPITDDPKSRHEIPAEAVKHGDLPEGSIISGDQKPFSRREARKVYDQTIADSPTREAMIMENVETGERIVIQGSESVVEWDPKARAEFLTSRLHGGVWRTVRHYHPIQPGTKVTHPVHRYASGGDMAGAQSDAQLTGKPQRERIDIMTESGPTDIEFGYDPGRGKKPFWTEVIGPDGKKSVKDFASVESYTEWYESQTGNYDPPPLPTEPAGRKAPGEEPPKRTGDPEGEHPPTIEPWPEGTIISGGEGRRFTLEDATRNYESLITADDTREALILEDVGTGEHVVIQGHHAITAATVERWAAFAKKRGGWGGKWRGVRHYHGLTVTEDGAKHLAPEHELPTGRGGDMESAQKDAMKYMRPTHEILDIVKDGRHIEIHYGYDYAAQGGPVWWIELPGRPRIPFKTLELYHFWFETETGVKHPSTLEPVNPKN